MNTIILDEKYKALKEDVEKYYQKIISNQKEPLIIDKDLHYIVDYLDQSTGLYCEAFVRQLTTENILVWDKELGETVCIDIDQLNIQDKIQILEIYEIETPHLCL